MRLFGTKPVCTGTAVENGALKKLAIGNQFSHLIYLLSACAAIQLFFSFCSTIARRAKGKQIAHTVHRYTVQRAGNLGIAYHDDLT
jgi:ABC-type multidrug transport system fused ATPase/permease subunit